MFLHIAQVVKVLGFFIRFPATKRINYWGVADLVLAADC